MTVLMDFGQTDGFGVPGRGNDRDGRSRSFNLSDGMTVKIEASDPYGFWYIRWGKGATPDAISGSYTGAMEAEKALERYLATEKYNTKIVDEPVKIPELQRKGK